MSTMIRKFKHILKLLCSFWITSISAELEYRLNLLIEILSVSGNLIGSIFLLSLFYTPTTNLGGWNWESSLVVLGIYTFLEGFTITFLQPNLTRIVRHIQDGTLDFILLKPIHSQIWVSFRIFSPWGIPSVVSGLILISYGLFNSNVDYSLRTIFISFLMLMSSIHILYSLWFIIATTSIWFVRVWNANEVLRSTLVAGRYPISSYPASLQKVLTFVIPIAFLTTVPAQAMMDRLSLIWCLYSLIISFLFVLISHKFWNYAIRFYTSASS